MNRLIEKVAAATIALATLVVVSTAFAGIAPGETKEPAAAACFREL
jgi:hypothetical protein